MTWLIDALSYCLWKERICYGCLVWGDLPDADQWPWGQIFSIYTKQSRKILISNLICKKIHRSHLMRKPVFGVCDQPAQLQRLASLKTSDIASIDTILSKQRTTKVLIRLRECAGWSAPLLFAYGIRHVFSWPGSYYIFSLQTKWIWHQKCTASIMNRPGEVRRDGSDIQLDSQAVRPDLHAEWNFKQLWSFIL